jgi:dienelactone hydrolase
MNGLPEILKFYNGNTVTNPSSWTARRKELLDKVLEIEYGRIPPSAEISATLMNVHYPSQFPETRHEQWKISVPNSQISFVIDLLIPKSSGPSPVIVNGDACWKYITPEIEKLILSNGYCLATFNRTELAPDRPDSKPKNSLYGMYPEMEFGAIAAWAWGYHRVIDWLNQHPRIDPKQIALSGHSRGGKCVLLAGATDERVALTAPNNSGCAGAGCFRIQGEGSETLEDILLNFPYWFHPEFNQYIHRVDELPFDQHSIKALIAPRALLTTEALDDLWANPIGTWYSHCAAKEVFDLLGQPDQIGIKFREGRHEHNLNDFKTLILFANWRFFGKSPIENFNSSPF